MPDVSTESTTCATESVPSSAELLSQRDKRVQQFLREKYRLNVLQLQAVAGMEDLANAANREIGGAEGWARIWKTAIDLAAEKGQPANMLKGLKLFTDVLDKIGQAGDRMAEAYTDEELRAHMAEALVGIAQQEPELVRALVEHSDDDEVTEGR